MKTNKKFNSILFIITIYCVSCVNGNTIENSVAPTIKIYVAKDIITMNEYKPSVKAVAVANGKIIEIGSLAELTEKLEGENYTIDKSFSDDIIFPGFLDQHLHPLLASLIFTMNIISIEKWELPNGTFEAITSPEEYIKELKKVEQSLKKDDEMLFTWGYHHLFHGKITRQELDQINNKRPILIWHRSAHEFIMNTPALELFEIDEEYLAKQSESAQKQLNFEEGHFWEQGGFAIAPKLVPYILTDERISEGLKLTRTYLQKNGVTTSVEPGGVVSKQVQDLANIIIGTENAPFRFYYIPDGKTMAQLHSETGNIIEKTEEFSTWGTPTSYFLPKQVKLFSDGAVFSQLMQMREGYLDGHHGEWIMDPSVFSKTFKIYWDAGYQIHIHQNGDKGLDLIIDEIEKNMLTNPRYDHRTLVSHFAFSTEDQVKRLRELGVLVSANPYYTVALGEKYSDVGVGPERATVMVRNRDILDHKIRLSFHSDMPMAPSDPLYLVWSAVNRIGNSGNIVGKQQQISVEEAFKAITIDAAYSLRMEDKIGSIEIGKDANFTILKEHPYEIDKNQIDKIEIVGTILEGRKTEF